MKQRQRTMPGSTSIQQQIIADLQQFAAGANSQPARGWPSAQDWHGQLGPNLMPMTESPPMQRPRNMQSNMSMRSPQIAQDDAMRNLLALTVDQGGQGRQRDEISGAMQISQMQAVPQMSNLQGQSQISQMQAVPQMSNLQGQMMQVIALPAGTMPPEGAIPCPVPSAAMQESPAPQMMQVIAVPVGEAPPEGAIPVEQFAVAAQPETTSPPRQSSRAFKIKDPKTGREVHGPGDEAAAGKRRMRIVNPKTGEEVRPNL